VRTVATARFIPDSAPMQPKVKVVQRFTAPKKLITAKDTRL